MKISHEIIPAPKDLADFIDGLWITVVDGLSTEMSTLQCCLPNGSWEIIFHLTPQRFCIMMDGKPTWMPELAGFATNGNPVYWQARGETLIFGLVLLPETMEMLTNRPTLLREMRYEDLRHYNQPIFEQILMRAKKADTTQKLVDEVFDALRTHLLHKKPDSHHAYFTEAMRLIRSSTDIPSLDDLSGQVYVSKRQLQRTFQDKLGFGPKAYSRMLRFRDAIHFMKQFPDKRITEVAYDFGYADQSHFIRDFKDFTGLNPRSFFSCWDPSTMVISSHKAYAYL